MYLVTERLELERVVATRSGRSVYALDQSPDGTKLIVGTRDRQCNDKEGQVSIWERRSDGSLSDVPLLSCLQPSSVTGVAMATSTVGMSGGLDGALRFWRLDEPHASVAEVQAHDGPVLAVSCLSSQIAFTIGTDGIGKIWDLDRLKIAQAFSDPKTAPVRRLLAIEPASDAGPGAWAVPLWNRSHSRLPGKGCADCSRVGVQRGHFSHDTGRSTRCAG